MGGFSQRSGLYRNILPLVMAAGSLAAFLLFIFLPFSRVESAPAKHANAQPLIEKPLQPEKSFQGETAQAEEELPPASPEEPEVPSRTMAPLEGRGEENSALESGLVREENERSMPIRYAASGYLVDRVSRKPIESRKISVRAFPLHDPGEAGGPEVAEVDFQRGAFSFRGLRLGLYSVWIEAEGYAPYLGELAVPWRGRQIIGLLPVGAVKVKATDLYARRLKKVRFREEGATVPGLPGSDPVSSRLEAGYYLVKGLRTGTRQLIAEAPGFKRVLLNVRVTPGEVPCYWAVFEH